ncbi:MAG: cytochrome c3 family protein [Acidobacteria bacterium]|nr:cytochrome c3 family protein [Acidobacteriota bacterium]
MNTKLVTIVLGVGLIVSVAVLVTQSSTLHIPGNQEGYQPPQPIAFSHGLHAGEMQISCFYCHSGADSSRHAGIPAASTCMNCHRYVTAPLGALREEDELAKKENRRPAPIVSPEIQKIYDALALNPKMEPDSQKTSKPIEWTRIYRLPDFTYFNHSAHVSVGVDCQTCHGPVETMEHVRQVSDLSMGWCVNCHRQANEKGIAGKQVRASLDCSTCHY